MAQRQRGRMRLVPQGAAEAVPLLQNAAQVAGQIGQLPLAADTLEDLATAQIMQSQARPAQEALIQALRLREALRHVPGQARVLSRLGLAFLMANDHAQADKALDRSLELAPEGDSAIQAAQLKGLVAMQQNRVDEAAPHMERAIALAEKSGAKETQATLMHNLAFVKEKQGNAAAADALRERARELAPGVSPQPNTLSVSFPPIAGDGGPSTTG
jgi:tetratricopeptide (TPR) repeat protein